MLIPLHFRPHAGSSRTAAVLLATSLIAGAAGAACRSEVLKRGQTIEAPKLQPGTTWSYSGGKELPTVTLQLVRAEADEAEYSTTTMTTRSRREIGDWTKSNPRAAADDRDPRDAAGGKTEVSGVNLTQQWYVPSLGRAVLKASVRVGDPFYGQAAEDLLRKGNTAIVELTGYESGQSRCAGQSALQARQPEQYVPLGYPAVANDTWQWAFQMREHHPRRSR